MVQFWAGPGMGRGSSAWGTQGCRCASGAPPRDRRRLQTCERLGTLSAFKLMLVSFLIERGIAPERVPVGSSVSFLHAFLTSFPRSSSVRLQDRLQVGGHPPRLSSGTSLRGIAFYLRWAGIVVRGWRGGFAFMLSDLQPLSDNQCRRASGLLRGLRPCPLPMEE